MKEYKTYVCEYCGKEFSENKVFKNPKEACEACEDSHASPINVSVGKYDYKSGARYPSAVTVEFDNGAVCTYYSWEEK